MSLRTASISGLSAIALCATVLSSAHASIITQDTRFAVGAPAGDYLTSFNDLRAGNGVEYGVTHNLAEYGPGLRNLYSAHNNIATEYTVQFGVNATQDGYYNLNFSGDAGYGGAVYLDGVRLAQNTNNYVGDGLAPPDIAFTVGNHTLQVVTFEDCCDGGYASGMFQSTRTGANAYFSSADGLNLIESPPAQNPVPEPASLALLGAGLLGLAASRRRA